MLNLVFIIFRLLRIKYNAEVDISCSAFIFVIDHRISLSVCMSFSYTRCACVCVSSSFLLSRSSIISFSLSSIIFSFLFLQFCFLSGSSPFLLYISLPLSRSLIFLRPLLTYIFSQLPLLCLFLHFSVSLCLPQPLHYFLFAPYLSPPLPLFLLLLP